MGRSCGGLTAKIHALVDAHGLPARLELAAGKAADAATHEKLLSGLKPGATALSDKAHDSDDPEPHQATQMLGQHPSKGQSQADVQLQPTGLPPAQPRGTFFKSE